jgi:hypothetical protein
MPFRFVKRENFLGEFLIAGKEQKVWRAQKAWFRSAQEFSQEATEETEI